MDTVAADGLAIGGGEPTRVMGVLNVSTESPYDPSVFDDPGAAAAYVDEELIGEGADIVDVGLESANKRFEVLGAEEELDRLDVAIETMASVGGDAVFSIETRYHEVAERAIEAGFRMVNDVGGFADPQLPDLCGANDVAVVKMASPPDLERPGAVEETDWASHRGEAWAEGADYVDRIYAALERGGLTEKTIVDPAFGGWSTAKTIEDDRDTFRRLREFRALGKPILVSINRKNFLREVTDRSTDDALPVSLAATSLAVQRGGDVVRTHDVAETLDAVRIGDAFAADPVRDEAAGVEELLVDSAGELGRYLDAEADVDLEVADHRVFALSDVDGDDRARLRAAAADTCVAVTGRSPIVLVGTQAACRRLADRLTARETLAEALAAVLSGFG
jgi:dihydropteroate synthase